MGALCYLVTKSIMLFQSVDDMKHTTCRAIKATVLHEEAIVIRVSPPSTTHMRAYMAVVGGEPSRTQPSHSDGKEVLHSPAGNPHPGGGMLQHLQADLRDLADGELCQLMEDLH